MQEWMIVRVVVAGGGGGLQERIQAADGSCTLVGQLLSWGGFALGGSWFVVRFAELTI